MPLKTYPSSPRRLTCRRCPDKPKKAEPAAWGFRETTTRHSIMTGEPHAPPAACGVLLEYERNREDWLRSTRRFRDFSRERASDSEARFTSHRVELFVSDSRW
jgi:hypothetical protein